MSEQQDTLDRVSYESATFPDGPSNTLVTIATFPGPAEADMARAALDASGITAFIQGENANSLLPVAFVARLQVRAADEASARALLETPTSDAQLTAAAEAASETSQEPGLR